MTASPTAPRKLRTSESRREDVLEAALGCFAAKGYAGTPTAEIAKAAGISQAYLFRIFPTKRELYIACVGRCMGSVREAFRRAAAPHAGDPEAMLAAMASTYHDLLGDRTMLLAQLQAYAASGDPEIGDAVRREFGRIVDVVRELTGAEDARISAFFATGMLLTVIAAMGAHELDEPWATGLLAGLEAQTC